MNREKAEAEHRKRIRAYEREIKRIYTSLVDEAAKIGTSVKNFDKSKPFRFDNYPQTRKRIEKLFDDYRTEVLATISGGIDNEFTKQNEFFLSVLRGYFSVPDNYYSPVNKKAVEAFIERKNNGMNLSQRVWKYSGQFKEELEMSIDLGLREGRSAQQMSRDIRKYLNNPDKLFRRVRDEHGNLQLSKNAKAFHPGAGVYRSSYKNAVRLTGTETNIAYRTADYDSIQTEDFVLGIRIELSNNHTTNGKPLTDICDELKGVYPKDFKFTGWHPNCRCKVITINASMDEVIDHIKNGTPYKGYITDTPPNFKKWVAENQEKLQTTNSLPYFVRDNEKYFPQMTITPKAMAGVKEAQKINEEMNKLTSKYTVVDSVEPNERKLLIQQREQEYQKYLAEPNYTNVRFNLENGGLMATQKGHLFHNSEKEQRFFDNKSSGQIESKCQEVLFNLGHKAILLNESNKLPNGNFLPSLDISINDKIMDIRFVTKSEVKTIVNILTAKAKQLKNVFTKTGIYSESVCLFFYDSSIYNDRLINLAIEEYRKNHRRIKEIYCVINNESGELKIYNI